MWITARKIYNKLHLNKNVYIMLTYCEDRDREMLVEEIIAAYRVFRERSALTNRVEPT